MFRYYYCDTLLESTFELPELSSNVAHIVGDSVGLFLDVDDSDGFGPAETIHRWCSRGNLTISIGKQRDAYVLTIPDSADFRYESVARTITIDREPAERQRGDLLNQVLPRVLDHQGRFIVHGAAAQRGDGTTIFLGDSGWGKSTLGAALTQVGGELLSDDCIELAIENETTMCRPTYQSLRLWPDSAATVQRNREYRRVSSQGKDAEKERFIAAAPDPQRNEPVRAIYFLNDPSDEATDIRIERISPALAVSKLIGCTFRLDPASASGARAAFDSAAEIVNRVPTFALSYPRDYEQLPLVVDAVTSHADKHGLDQQS